MRTKSLSQQTKGPCTQIVHTWALNHLYRDYTKANVTTIWVHRALGSVFRAQWGWGSVAARGFKKVWFVVVGHRASGFKA